MRTLPRLLILPVLALFTASSVSAQLPMCSEVSILEVGLPSRERISVDFRGGSSADAARLALAFVQEWGNKRCSSGGTGLKAAIQSSNLVVSRGVETVYGQRYFVHRAKGAVDFCCEEALVSCQGTSCPIDWPEGGLPPIIIDDPDLGQPSIDGSTGTEPKITPVEPKPVDPEPAKPKPGKPGKPKPKPGKPKPGKPGKPGFKR